MTYKRVTPETIFHYMNVTLLLYCNVRGHLMSCRRKSVFRTHEGRQFYIFSVQLSYYATLPKGAALSVALHPSFCLSVRPSRAFNFLEILKP